MTSTKVCGMCKEEKDLTLFRVMTENRAKIPFKYHCSWCKQCEKERALRRHNANKEQNLEKSRNYKGNNKDKINARRREYTREKMKDTVERIKRDLKCLITAKIKKTKHSSEYLGTSVELIVKWLEWNFQEGMTWENHGKVWQIDHTLAINSFKLLEERECLDCFNWKNLMPLPKELNARKSDKIYPYRVLYQEHRLRKFFHENTIVEDLEDYLMRYSLYFKRALDMQHAQIAGNS
jgi:hypothetical protein